MATDLQRTPQPLQPSKSHPLLGSQTRVGVGHDDAPSLARFVSALSDTHPASISNPGLKAENAAPLHPLWDIRPKPRERLCCFNLPVCFYQLRALHLVPTHDCLRMIFKILLNRLVSPVQMIFFSRYPQLTGATSALTTTTPRQILPRVYRHNGRNRRETIGQCPRT